MFPVGGWWSKQRLWAAHSEVLGDYQGMRPEIGAQGGHGLWDRCLTWIKYFCERTKKWDLGYFISQDCLQNCKPHNVNLALYKVPISLSVTLGRKREKDFIILQVVMWWGLQERHDQLPHGEENSHTASSAALPQAPFETFPQAKVSNYQEPSRNPLWEEMAMIFHCSATLKQRVAGPVEI